MGLYRCVVITCRYTLPPSSPPIFAALAQVIHAHPMLRVGILGEDTNDAHFSYIPEINLAKHVEFRTLPAGEEYGRHVEILQAWCHDQLWKDIETCPPWRIVVARPDERPGFEDIFFSYHHSLMDGSSGKQFHEHLLRELNSDLAELESLTLAFPRAPTLPEAQHSILAYSKSVYGWASTLWDWLSPPFLKSVKPTIWFGQHIDFTHPHTSRVHAVDISAPVVTSLLTATRQHGTTLTGLFHALSLASLTNRLPDAPAFASSTPISMRRHISPSADPMTKDSFRVLISGMTHHFPSTDISALRSPKAHLDTLIWHHARQVKTQLRDRVSTLPTDDDASLLAHISDWDSYWRQKDGKPREESWELSNIGPIQLPPLKEGHRTISHVLFTNGIMVAGGPMSISISSVPGGALTLGISWNDSVVDNEVMEGLGVDFARFAERLHDTGKFAA